MNPNNMNQASQNQRGSYQNYASGHIKNQIQVPYIVNNSNEIFYLQRLPQIINTNDMPLGYNPINIIPSQSNPSHQILLPNSNIISNLPFAKQNQIPWLFHRRRPPLFRQSSHRRKSFLRKALPDVYERQSHPEEPACQKRQSPFRSRLSVLTH